MAGLRLLSGETRSLSALPTANTQAACGPGADPCALFAAVYIGVFNVAQFRTRLIDLQPDLGERGNQRHCRLRANACSPACLAGWTVFDCTCSPYTHTTSLACLRVRALLCSE